MDPISFIASLAAIIQLSAKVAGILKEMRSGSEDRIRLREEVRGTQHLLQMLQDRVEDAEFCGKDLASITSLDLPGGPLDQLTNALKRLVAKLAPSGRVLQVSRALLWPFSKDEVNELVNIIERQKTAFNLAISNDNIALSLAMKTQVTEMNKKLTTMEISHGKHQTKVVSQQDDAILAWLSPLTFWARQQDIISTRAADTGGWLLESTQYHIWRNGSDRTLWCHGMPGAGKTVLASIIVENLLQNQSSRTDAVAFVYCNYKERAQQTSDHLISSLVRQLLDRRSAIPDQLHSLYDRSKHQDRRPSGSELLELLSTVASKFSSLFFVIDALDECSESDGARSTLLSGLRKLLPAACFLYTSRYLSEIEHQLEGCSRLEIRARDGDIRRYAKGRIPDEPRLAKHITADSGLLGLLLKTIVGRSDGMFLLAQLHLSTLAMKHTRKALRSGLQSLPTQLDLTYEEALQRIHDQNKEDASLAKQVLMWISHAMDPLTISELQHAIAIMGLEKGTELGEDDLPDEDVLSSVCAGLVSIDKESNVVRLVHYTTQDFLQRNPVVDHEKARKSITEACVAYLSQTSFNQGPCNNDEALQYRLMKYPLLQYAARNWGNHARGSPEDLCEESIRKFLQTRHLRDSSQQASEVGSPKTSIVLGRSQWYRKNVSKLSTAAHFGLTRIVNMLLRDGEDVEGIDDSGSTALHRAAANGRIAIINALLAARADINKLDLSGQSILMEAVRHGQLEAVGVLLDNGVRVNYKMRHGETALGKAVSSGYTSIAMRLLEGGADAGVDDSRIMKAAIRSGKIEMIELIIEMIKRTGAESKNMSSILNSMFWESNLSAEIIDLLIKKGADPAYCAKNGETLIHVAAKRGLPDIVEILLKHGVDPNQRAALGDTPLHWATFRGNLEAVKLLLSNGADPNQRNVVGDTPLHQAAFLGNLAAVKVLLSKGADIAALNFSKESVLLSCLHYTSHDDIVSYLLGNGVDLNAIDLRGQTALYEAAYRGFGSIVQILIDHGAPINHKDNRGWTAIQHAAASGQEGTVNQLLEQAPTQDSLSIVPLLDAARFRTAIAMKDHDGIQRLLRDPSLDVTVPDHEGRTALHHAAYHGDTDIVKTLLARGASVHARIADSAFNYRVNSQGFDRETLQWQLITPLHNTACRGHVEIVQMLLDHGADVDARGSQSYKPFLFEIRKGFISYIDWLLDSRGNVSDRDDIYQMTSISRAVLEGKNDVVRVLLEHGAGVERDTKHGRRTLQLATRRKHTEIVELLIEYGFKA